MLLTVVSLCGLGKLQLVRCRKLHTNLQCCQRRKELLVHGSCPGCSCPALQAVLLHHLLQHKAIEALYTVPRGHLGKLPVLQNGCQLVHWIQTPQLQEGLCAAQKPGRQQLQVSYFAIGIKGSLHLSVKLTAALAGCCSDLRWTASGSSSADKTKVGRNRQLTNSFWGKEIRQ
jgi:hypothetical protein